MEWDGEERIAAPRAAVWNALNDADLLKSCIPGCEALDYVSDHELTATIRIKIWPIKATFGGTITLSNVVPSESYVISGEGKGGIAGFARGSAAVTISDERDGTLLRYRTEAEVGGKIAQLGSKLIASSANRLAARFFADFSREVCARQEAAPPDERHER